MSPTPKSPARLEILVLSSLARQPMHGYEIKLEFRYKHVRWWAKAEHGHIYATLTRLEKGGFIAPTGQVPADGRKRKVYAITSTGRERLNAGLLQVGRAPDATMFDIDLFISGSFLMALSTVLEVLDQREQTVSVQLADAKEIKARMSPYVPASGHLIIEHRIDHLALELDYARRAADAFRSQATWGSFLGGQSIEQFLSESGVDLEEESS
jgi:DNA-binding PadR family transcriptional regulator